MVSFNVTHPLWLVTFPFQNADVLDCIRRRFVQVNYCSLGFITLLKTGTLSISLHNGPWELNFYTSPGSWES